MSNPSRHEFHEMLGLLVPDSSPKNRIHNPGESISPERKQAFINQLLNLWDKCNDESATESVKVKRQYRKHASEDEASSAISPTEASDA